MIKLEDDDPDVVEAMLHYVYHFDYTYPSKEQNRGQKIVFDVNVHTIADKYNVAGLTNIAASKFTARAKSEWKTPGFAEAISEVYTVAADPDRELRNAIIAICSEKAGDLAVEHFGAPVRAAASLLPAFGGDLFTKIASRLARPPKPDGDTRYKCPSCGKTFAMKGVSDDNYETRNCPYCPYTYRNWTLDEVMGD